MKNIYLSIALFLFSFCALVGQSYTNIESVEYDAGENRFLVSNSNSIIQRASDGTLSYFGSGSASHGMEVMNGYLFACSSGTRLKAFELDSEDEVMNLNIPSAGFLNGLTNDGNNKLWATDFSNDRIYEFDVTDVDNPTYNIVVYDTEGTPNGIVYDGSNNRLIYVTWGSNASIKAVDLDDYSVTTLTNTPYGSIDGIDEDNNGDYYIAYWQPAGVSKYDSDFSGSPTTISVPGINSPADICYAKEIDSLAIPSGGNQVLFVGFETTPVGNIVNEEYQFSMGPNPMQDKTCIQFHLEQSEVLELHIFDLNGQLVRTLIQQEMQSGWHKVMLTGIELSQGMYLIHMETPKGIITEKLQVH